MLILQEAYPYVASVKATRYAYYVQYFSS